MHDGMACMGCMPKYSGKKAPAASMFLGRLRGA
jgi:hypothetical protein